MMLWAKIKMAAAVVCATTVLGAGTPLALKAVIAETERPTLMENKYLKITESADGKGLTLISKLGGSRADVFLVGAKGQPARKLDKQLIKLPENVPFIEVSPAAEAVEVRAKMRFGLVPYAHGNDGCLIWPWPGSPHANRYTCRNLTGRAADSNAGAPTRPAAAQRRD